MLDSLNRNRTLACAMALLCLALALPCIAQETSDEAGQLYSVKGVVLNSVTHQPVARVLVDSHQGAVLTDNDGHFELNLPEGITQISIKRPGYGARGQPSNRAVRVGPNLPSLTFEITPEALITGQVTLSTSDPADGIRVFAYRRRVINGRQQWTVETSTRTNSEGAFRIAGLQSGDYLIYTIPSRDTDGPLTRGEAVYGYPASYYPGVSDMAAAGMLTLSAGQHAEADFILTRQQFYPVTFSVTDRAIGAGINLQIHDRSGHPVGVPVRFNAEQGTATTNLPSGSYFLEARYRAEAQLYGRVDFTVAGAPVSGVHLALAPLHPIPVTIRRVFTSSSNGNGGGVLLADGSPANGPSGAGLNISLTAADEVFAQMRGVGGLRAVEGSTDASAFEIENITPGRYWVETSPFDGYVSSITSGGVDLARDPLVVGLGGSTAPIEVTLRDDSATITAQINGALPGSQSSSSAAGEQHEVYVYAIPLFQSSSPIRMSGGQGSGEVSISGLAPGSYRVVAFDAPQEIDFHTPEALTKYIALGETATVDAGGSAHVQLDIIHTGNTEPE